MVARTYTLLCASAKALVNAKAPIRNAVCNVLTRISVWL
jgi:hypothetical protein